VGPNAFDGAPGVEMLRIDRDDRTFPVVGTRWDGRLKIHSNEFGDRRMEQLDSRPLLIQESSQNDVFPGGAMAPDHLVSVIPAQMDQRFPLVDGMVGGVHDDRASDFEEASDFTIEDVVQVSPDIRVIGCRKGITTPDIVRTDHLDTIEFMKKAGNRRLTRTGNAAHGDNDTILHTLPALLILIRKKITHEQAFFNDP
jgi:hypothetical protein